MNIRCHLTKKSRYQLTYDTSRNVSYRMRTLQTTTEHGNIMYSDTVCYTGTCDAAPVPVHQQPSDAGAHGHGRLPAPAPAAH